MQFKGQELAPLYVIVWRLLWYIPYMVLRVLLCFVVCMCWGLDRGRWLWEETS